MESRINTIRTEHQIMLTLKSVTEFLLAPVEPIVPTATCWHLSMDELVPEGVSPAMCFLAGVP